MTDGGAAFFVHQHLARRRARDDRQAGPGWFRDPEHVAAYRFWDGERWTDHTTDTLETPHPDTDTSDSDTDSDSDSDSH